MLDHHLSDLRKKLAANAWKVVQESTGAGGKAVFWQVQRKPGHGPFHLEFESFHAGEPAPIEQGYGVRIRELKQTSVYLYRKHNDRAWNRVMDELVDSLERLDGNHQPT